MTVVPGDPFLYKRIQIEVSVKEKQFFLYAIRIEIFLPFSLRHPFPPAHMVQFAWLVFQRLDPQVVKSKVQQSVHREAKDGC